MIILGIDPGTATTGYGIIEEIKSKNKKEKVLRCLDYGIIQTSPDSPPAERLKKINNDLLKIITKYRPQILAIESIFFFRNLKTAIPVSQASGVILMTAAKKKVPVHTFTPLQVKLAITGYGWAEKELVQKKLKKILGLKICPKPDDIADALAIALAYTIKEA